MVTYSGSSSSAPIVEMQGITKRFPGVLANSSVDLSIRRGEVLALLGENGAGKTTLMNILSGLYKPDSGTIIVNGEPANFASPRDAIKAGIGVVHQHFQLVNVFTVSENIALSLTDPKLQLKLKDVEKSINQISRQYAWNINPRACIWQLGVGEQQRVAILKALIRGAEVLVLDEPTAVLTPQEAEELTHALRELAAAGQAVVYISHKLKDVMEVADRIAVLQSGANVATLKKTDTNKEELTKLMIGRDVPILKKPVSNEPGPLQLEIENLHVAGEVPGNQQVLALRGFSLQVHAGEIVGLAGVSGNGQSELAEAIAGLKKVEKGSIKISGTEIANRHPVEIIRNGLSLIPEDRLGTGLVPSLNLLDNSILKNYRCQPISNGLFLDLDYVRKFANKLVSEFSIQCAKLEDPIWKLSGGNLQRLLLARELSSQPKIMVAVHPTRGLDVRAVNEIHQLLLKLRDDGGAILLISDDLDEILAVSDQIAVIHNGELMGQLDSKDADVQNIGLMMTGSCTKVTE